MFRFKTSETLLGIETVHSDRQKRWQHRLQNLWNPFRDWNSYLWAVRKEQVRLQNLWNPFRDWNWFRVYCRQPKPMLQNLWNPFRDWNYKPLVQRKDSEPSFKTSETLLGIETCIGKRWSSTHLLQNLWNPFRDWNLLRWVDRKSHRRASKPLKPF